MLSFDSTNHQYTWDGKVVPSVSKVIETCAPFNVYGNSENAVKSAEFGKNLHRILELKDKGTLGDYSSVAEPWIVGWEKFLADHEDYEMVSNEQILYSRLYRYAGTIDRLFKKVLLHIIADIKSGAKCPTWPLRMAAYEQLVKENFELPKTESIIVQLVENDYRPHFVGRFRENFNTFLSMLNVYKWRMRNGYKSS